MTYLSALGAYWNEHGRNNFHMQFPMKHYIFRHDLSLRNCFCCINRLANCPSFGGRVPHFETKKRDFTMCPSFFKNLYMYVLKYRKCRNVGMSLFF